MGRPRGRRRGRSRLLFVVCVFDLETGGVVVCCSAAW